MTLLVVLLLCAFGNSALLVRCNRIDRSLAASDSMGPMEDAGHRAVRRFGWLDVGPDLFGSSKRA